MLNIIVTWLLSATLLFFTSRLVDGFEIPDFTMAFIASALIGLLNIMIRPLLNYLAININLATLGIFTFAINAVVLKNAANMMKSFEIDGWMPALLIALLLTLVQVTTFLLNPSQKKILWTNPQL